MELKKQFRIIYTGVIMLLAILGVLAILMFQSYAKFEKSNQSRYDSFRLADELRQTSDDLTRFSRTYVLTGDSTWEKKYWEVLDIRNGLKPRSDGRTIALRDSMINLGFSKREFDKLNEAEDNSNELVWTEIVAFNAMKGLFDDGTGQFTVKKVPDIAFARRIMFDDKYHADKTKIMNPIDDFIKLLDDRTRRVIAKHSHRSNKLLGSIIVLIILIGGISIISYFKIKNKIIKQLEDLEIANKELDAFSYSVSHDLRAPLRAIDGFTSILIEDYASKLDKEAKRLGSNIRDNAKKMGKLVDNLLTFSRMGRVSIIGNKIDMKSMVYAMYHEATSAKERKRITFNVAKLPQVEGDTNLMRQVWINLISNAVKFSSQRKQAIISVTFKEGKNKVTYCIKDNGVGFNMKYVDKLFGVFERLHSENDFEGTGIGLSFVKRIINRHDGKVWVEGNLNKGAEFYFSLPNKNRKT